MTQEEVAEKIVEYYEQEVRSDRSSRYRARKSVLALLRKGISRDALWGCVNLYASEVDWKGEEFRKVAGNFFGREAVYINYIDEAKAMMEKHNEKKVGIRGAAGVRSPGGAVP
jgi:hypothetical protein